MNKARDLRNLLFSRELEFICEVHNPLTAKIVEEAGFKAMWGSSLTISASMGVRDCNELSWTQVISLIELINDAANIPLLLDADTGYGNFNSVRRLVKKVEQVGVAGICIEDKLFPKKNSFINGDRQPLASIEEFAGKIKAAKDTQQAPDFIVVARVEAFIAGWGLGEALKRADAYERAGADCILIHSKIQKPDEVLSFMAEWGKRCPVLIVPTKYYTTPTEVFRNAGFSAVIWANTILRSAVKAMQQTADQLKKDQSLIDIEGQVASVAEIFRLQEVDELERAEKVYLPKTGADTHAIILAAAQGIEFGSLTQDRPKAMLDAGGKPLLYRQIDMLNEISIKNITVVRGFCKDLINAPNLSFVDNDEYAETEEVYSFYKGIQGMKGPTLVSYGDILYKKYIASTLLETEEDFVIAVDSDCDLKRYRGRYADFVCCDQPYRKQLLDQDVELKKMSSSLKENEICGEWIGLLKLSAAGAKVMGDLLSELRQAETFKKMHMAELCNELIRRGSRIKVQYIRGGWVDVNDINDLRQAKKF